MAEMLETKRRTHTAEFIKTDADRAVFFKDPAVDNLFTAVMTMGAELWAVRRRQKITEALLEKHSGITPEMIEVYAPSVEQNAQWTAERDAFVKSMMEPFLRTADIPYGSTLQSPSGPAPKS